MLEEYIKLFKKIKMIKMIEIAQRFQINENNVKNFDYQKKNMKTQNLNKKINVIQRKEGRK